MQTTTCDNCKKNVGSHVPIVVSLNNFGISSSSPRYRFDFCSWRCVEDFAKGHSK